MTDSKESPVMHRGRKRGKHTALGVSILRLYRNDTVWRGAVDLAAIGALIMLLVQGFPDVFSFMDRFTGNNVAQGVPPQPAPAPPAASTGVTGASAVNAGITNSGAGSIGMPGANFSKSAVVKPVSPPATPAAQTDLPMLTAMFGHVSPEDKEILDRGRDLVAIDPSGAIDLLKDKAAEGENNFQFTLGLAYMQLGLSTSSEDALEKGIYWLKEAAANSNPNAQYQLGQVYRLGVPGIPPQYDIAVGWYERATKNSLNTFGRAENELGRLYEAGVYFNRDTQKALQYYEAGGRKGNGQAAANAGAIYMNGKGIPRDIAKGVFWTRMGADKGDAQSEMNLATMYKIGAGVPLDYAEFLKWAGLAEDQGYRHAFIDLGDFYMQGHPGFPADYQQAAQHYRRAALKKDPQAQYKLAQMYENGYGLPQDSIQAYVYYSMAYKSGAYAPAYAAMQSLKARLSPAQLEYGEKMSVALNPSGPASVFRTNYAGMGTGLDFVNGRCYVVSVFPHSPAEKAGVKTGDEIVALDGQPISGMDKNKAMSLMRGPENSTFQLTYLPKGSQMPVTTTITRAMIAP